jgi:hypothetical protein
MRHIRILAIGLAVLSWFSLTGPVPVLAQSPQLNLTYCPDTPPNLKAWFDKAKRMFGKTDGNPLAAVLVCYEQEKDHILITLAFNTSRSKIEKDNQDRLSNGFFWYIPEYGLLLKPDTVLDNKFFRSYWDFAVKKPETTIYPRRTIFVIELLNAKGDVLRLPTFIPDNSSNITSAGIVCIQQKNKEAQCFTGKPGNFPRLSSSTDIAGNLTQQGVMYNMALNFFSIEKAVAKLKNRCKPDSMHTCD